MVLRELMLDYIRRTYIKKGRRFYEHTSFVGMSEEEVGQLYLETKMQQDSMKHIKYMNCLNPEDIIKDSKVSATSACGGNTSGSVINIFKRIYLLLILCHFCIACDVGRTPSKQRLEWICKVKLPREFVVLKDDYKDMWQYYCVLYEIQFTEKSKNDFLASIRNSVYFRPCPSKAGRIADDSEGKSDRSGSAWQKSRQGYTFHQKRDLTTYWIVLDTVRNTLKYEECAN